MPCVNIFENTFAPCSLLHDAIDQAVGQGLLCAEEVVAVEVQGHLLARLAAQLRVVGDLETGRQAGVGRNGRQGLSLVDIAGETSGCV